MDQGSSKEVLQARFLEELMHLTDTLRLIARTDQQRIAGVYDHQVTNPEQRHHLSRGVHDVVL